MRDADLIQRVVEQRPGAFDELYYAYVERVHRQLFSIVGPDRDLDDLLQATFVQVFRNIASYRAESSFSTWLHRVALNVALTHLRKRQRWLRAEEPLTLPDSVEGAGRPDDAYDRSEARRALYEVLGRLKPDKRLAFVLYEIDGHTLEEIAELCDAPLNTVAARLRAARQEMRKHLERRMRRGGEAPAQLKVGGAR